MDDELRAYLDALEHDSRYRVERILKEGAACRTEIVWLVGADGSQLGPFVRKVFRSGSGMGGAYQRIWEAQNAGRRFLHLPRIVECYTAGGCFAAVSEFVRGETLADVVYRCDPSFELAADVVPQICDALSELHRAFEPPIIHRDLKPSNVVLSQGSLTLIDFGIARSFDESADVDTHRFGTRAYAPPEQFGFGQTDVRSDVYALGLLAYYCLTEKTPDAEARRNGWRSPAIPEPVRRVIAKAASFDPVDRFGDVAGFKEAFLAAVEEVRAGRGPARGAVGKAAGPVSAAGPTGEAPPPSAGCCGPDAALPPAGGGVAASGAPADPGILAGRVSRFLRAIPRPLGIVWDIAILCVLMLFFAACIDNALNPAKGGFSEDSPFLLRLAAYLCMFFTLFLPAGFLVCDRRPLERLVTPLSGIPLVRQIAFALGLMIVGVVATGLIVGLIPQA